MHVRRSLRRLLVVGGWALLMTAQIHLFMPFFHVLPLAHIVAYTCTYVYASVCRATHNLSVYVLMRVCTSLFSEGSL